MRVSPLCAALAIGCGTFGLKAQAALASQVLGVEPNPVNPTNYNCLIEMFCTFYSMGRAQHPHDFRM
jgi:hypothetical protein